MRIEDIFLIVKSKWPARIDISGSELLEGGGFLSWELIKIEESIEEESITDAGIVQAAIWPFHQALGCVARRNFETGEFVISPDEVSLSVFAHFLEEALREPSWADEREIFVRENYDI